ncbi:MAG: M23 family metallopeptidase [Actinomycetota bacterium]
MPRARSLRRTAIALLLAAGLLSPISPIAAGASPSPAAGTVKAIIFPVDGKVSYTDTWGAARSGGRTHEGTDIMGQQMLPLLAAVDGTVVRVKFDNTSSGGNSVVIQGADGWTYHYIHVNNDTPGTDDGQATRDQAFPPDIVAGATVRRGQVVAYMGDSGNAEDAGRHLHFEIREPAAPGGWIGSGAAINPYESLRQAPLWSSQPRWELRRSTRSTGHEEQFAYGLQTGDRALLCDWDGDGLDEPGIVRGAEWHLRSGLPSGTTSARIRFGTGDEVVLCGDLDGAPGDEPVLFTEGGMWTVRAGFGPDAPVAYQVRYGMTAGDRPVLGDWDGNGADDLGIHRRGVWHLRSGGEPAGRTIREVSYGLQPGDLPVAGDWDGTGGDDLGILRAGTLHLRSSSVPWGWTIGQVVVGVAGDQPVAGRWLDQAPHGFGAYRIKRT